MYRKVSQKGFSPIILILVLLILIGGVYFFDYKQGGLSTRSQTSKPNANQSEVTISGSIVDSDTSCYHDSVCKVKVDNYWIITNLGGDPTPEGEKHRGPRGSIISTEGTTTGNVGNNVTGKQVEVFAKVIDSNTLTLYGKKDYYIKFKD